MRDNFSREVKQQLCAESTLQMQFCRAQMQNIVRTSFMPQVIAEDTSLSEVLFERSKSLQKTRQNYHQASNFILRQLNKHENL